MFFCASLPKESSAQSNVDKVVTIDGREIGSLRLLCIDTKLRDTSTPTVKFSNSFVRARRNCLHYLSGGNNYVDVFFEAIIRNPNFRHIYFDDGFTQTYDTWDRGEQCIDFKRLRSLRRLTLLSITKENRWDETSLESFCSYLTNAHCPVKRLELLGCFYDDANELEKLAEAIEKNTSIATVITPYSEELAKYLSKERLQKLDLNPESTDLISHHAGMT